MRGLRFGNKHDDEILEGLEAGVWNAFTPEERRQIRRTDRIIFWQDLGVLVLLPILLPLGLICCAFRFVFRGRFFAE